MPPSPSRSASPTSRSSRSSPGKNPARRSTTISIARCRSACSSLPRERSSAASGPTTRGPLLGLGPEGNLGAHHPARLPHRPPWAYRRYWGGFGMAVGSVVSFLAVLMAWYGVNFVLGVGLHSYGFGTGGFGWALGFVALEILFVAAAFAKNRSLRPASAAKSVRSPKNPLPPASRLFPVRSGHAESPPPRCGCDSTSLPRRDTGRSTR